MTVVFLAYNRRDDLRRSLDKTLGLEYDRDRLDVIVVDNASSDGTAQMLARDYPDVQVVARSENSGLSGFNDGFALASGDYVLALDDDCHLPPDGLRRAIDAAREHAADLVSFGVESAEDPRYRFDLHECLTGLLSFWGCAVLFRREVVQELGGYDPSIFVWANELEFMLRFYDRGFRHLHLPEVVAVHAKPPGQWSEGRFPVGPYRTNTRNLAFVAAKRLSRRDAAEALVALVVRAVRDGVRATPAALLGVLDAVRGFSRGLAERGAVRPEVSHAVRHNFEQLASPWWTWRPPRQLARDVLRHGLAGDGDTSRREEWFARRERFYPKRRGVLQF